jgi:glycosyltransferase involved in cell wall biosynthesis
MTPDVLVGDRKGAALIGIADPPASRDSGGAPLSIGLVSPAWPPEAFANGIVTHVAGLRDGLSALGHRVTILAARVAPGDWGEHVYDLSRVGSNPGLLRRLADWLLYRAAPKLLIDRVVQRGLVAAIDRAVAERRIQVLEMEESFGLAGQVQQGIRIPVSIRLHGPWFLNGSVLGLAEDARFRRRVAAEEWAIRRAEAVTAPTANVLTRTRKYYRLTLEHAEAIPNPIRPVPLAKRWRPEECEPRTVLFIGRFDYHKGGDLIVEAFWRVLRVVPDARLCFVGPDQGLVDDGGRRWDLESFVDDRLPGARASGRVRLLGQQPGPVLDGLRRRAALTVVCSRYEVFGYTAAEAMALGSPIVAARVGGLSELLRDGVDSLLHRVGDPDDLAAKIVTLLTDPARAAELGRQAAVRCEQDLRPEMIASRMAAHYRRLRERAASAARTIPGRRHAARRIGTTPDDAPRRVDLSNTRHGQPVADQDTVGVAIPALW